MPQTFEEVFPLPPITSPAEALLIEWARWWWNDESAPEKLPDALHIRTSIYFTKNKEADGTNQPANTTGAAAS